MTTFQFPLILNDSEAMALNHAIDLYEKQCAEQIANDGPLYFHGQREMMDRLRIRWYEKPQMTSTNDLR